MKMLFLKILYKHVGGNLNRQDVYNEAMMKKTYHNIR